MQSDTWQSYLSLRALLQLDRFAALGAVLPKSGVSGNDFWGFGNGNGNRKFHSQSLGTGRELKIPFPKFGNGKGMKKSIPKIREREGNEKRHSRNSGTGREWKKTFPKFGNGNQRLLFPGMDGNGNGNGTKKLRWLELIENVVKCSENKGRVPKKNEKIVPIWETGGGMLKKEGKPPCYPMSMSNFHFTFIFVAKNCLSHIGW